MGPWHCLRTAGTAGAVILALCGPAAGQLRPATPTATTAPRAFLIYLIDGGDPIVVRRYVEEDDQVRFEKYGGWVGIPRYEVLRIVPDQPEEEAAALLPPSLATPLRADAPLYVATRGGANLRATAVGAEGTRVRVTTPEGSLTMPRADLVGVLRVPAAPGSPEAWLTLTDLFDGQGPAPPASAPPGAPTPPSTISDRPHLLQLAGGIVIRIDGFWIEAGEIRFRRLGGVVGFALNEVARLIPQDPAPIAGRVAVRFLRRLAADRLEIHADREIRRVRLIGVEPLPGASGTDDPWAPLERGLRLQIEFDRQRYAAGGDWLAYVYLPNGRMLNAELIRVGAARPRPEERNIRYLDLFGEIWTARHGASAPSEP